MDGPLDKDEAVLLHTSSSPTRDGAAVGEEARPESHPAIHKEGEGQVAPEKTPKKVPVPEGAEEIQSTHPKQIPKTVPVPSFASETQYEVQEVDGSKFLVRKSAEQSKTSQVTTHSGPITSLPCLLGVASRSSTPTQIPYTDPKMDLNQKSHEVLQERMAAAPNSKGLCPHGGLNGTLSAAPGPARYPAPPAALFTKKVTQETFEVHALLRSISLELNRAAPNFTSESDSLHLSFEPELCAKASLSDEANSPPADPVVRPPAVEQADLAFNMWASASPVWDSLKRQSSESDFSTKASTGDESSSTFASPLVQMPAGQEVDVAPFTGIWSDPSGLWDLLQMPWGADCLQYGDAFVNMVDYSRPAGDHLVTFNHATYATVFEQYLSKNTVSI